MGNLAHLLDSAGNAAPGVLLFAGGTAAGIFVTDLLKPARPSLAWLRRLLDRSN